MTTRGIIWALFGNDEDGPIGDPGWNPSREDTVLIRIKWWMRNPFHNLMMHVLAVDPITHVKIWPHDQPNGPWDWPAANTGMIFAVFNRWAPLFAGRSKRWEWYIGWRGDSTAKRAAPGMTFRRR